MFGFRREPVAIIGLIQAVIYLVTEFGVTVTPGQQSAIVLVVNAFMVVFLRSQVTSETTLQQAGTSRAEMQKVAADPYASMAIKRDWDRYQ